MRRCAEFADPDLVEQLIVEYPLHVNAIIGG